MENEIIKKIMQIINTHNRELTELKHLYINNRSEIGRQSVKILNSLQHDTKMINTYLEMLDKEIMNGK